MVRKQTKVTASKSNWLKDRKRMVSWAKRFSAPTAAKLAKKVPGYKTQTYAAIIAHVTMGTY